jgi:hypothetical protein
MVVVAEPGGVSAAPQSTPVTGLLFTVMVCAVVLMATVALAGADTAASVELCVWCM